MDWSPRLGNVPVDLEGRHGEVFRALLSPPLLSLVRRLLGLGEGEQPVMKEKCQLAIASPDGYIGEDFAGREDDSSDYHLDGHGFIPNEFSFRKFHSYCSGAGLSLDLWDIWGSATGS